VPYRALDPELIAWVHTCIPWGVMTAYERFNRPLSTAEKDRYLAEQSVLGLMSGADEVLTSVAELDAFIAEMRPKLAVDELTQELHRSPSVDEIAARAGVRPDEVVEATDVATVWRPASLDERFEADDGDDGRQVPAAADLGFSSAEGRADLDPLLARLSPRARLALRLRFVEDLTQSEIAARLGVSQMQVSRILSSSLARLRAWHVGR
jgi:RNA polymerase sigma factor (sigma-70 family)